MPFDFIATVTVGSDFGALQCLRLGRKPMANIDSILKSRDITLPTKVHIVKAVVFPVGMYRSELDHKEG